MVTRAARATLAAGLVLLLALVAHAASSRRFMDMKENEVDALLAENHALPYPERLARLSSYFLGTPYATDPLGEGPGARVDTDPTFRLDRVDCVTFIEQLWGLAGSRTLANAKDLTQKIRYAKGIIDYKHRLHLTWAQWLPENEKTRFVVDITKDFGGEDTTRETFVLNLASCSGRWKDFCARLGSAFPAGEHTRDVLPLKAATARENDIPHGTLLFVVLEHRAWLPYRIVHVGLVLDGKTGKVFRHASRRRGRVVDEPLAAYLRTLANHTPKRPVTGVILARFNPPPAVDSVPEQGEKLPAPPQVDHPSYLE